MTAKEPTTAIEPGKETPSVTGGTMGEGEGMGNGGGTDGAGSDSTDLHAMLMDVGVLCLMRTFLFISRLRRR